jgi:hypothetical protein
MKKLKISIALLMGIIVSFQFTSCKKDNFTEKDAMNLQNNLNSKTTLLNDSITRSSLRITYSVNLVDASVSTLKSTKSINAISGAVIRLTQNSKVFTITTDSTGIAVFDSLKVGSATVNINLSGYSMVNYVVNFANGSFSSGVAGGHQFANIIPLIPISGSSMGTIKGLVTCESDLTNLVPDAVPAGTKIIAIPSVNSAAFITPNNTNLITNISYDNLALTTTTDANGNYSLSVPATLNGLSYTITVADFTTNQQLLVNTLDYRDTTGVVTIPATFGSDITNAFVTSIPSVTSAYVTISTPDYTYTPAVATAVLGDGNGIDNIQLTNSGGNYTAGKTFAMPIDTPYFPGTATSSPGSATFTINNYGQVSGITVSSGSHYQASVDNSSISIPYFLQEGTFSVDTGNNNGAIVSTSIILSGKYFISDPSQITIINVSGNGSAALLTPNFSYTGSYYQLTSISINKGGSGYAKNQKFIVRVNSNLSNLATGTIHLQTGVVSAIQVSNQGVNYISGKINVVINPPKNGGTQATATATVSNGKITSINVTNSGSGYSSAPSVNVISTVVKIQAKATVTIDNGSSPHNGNVTSIAITTAGQGYLSAPTVTIIPSIPGFGSGATAIASIDATSAVSGITITNTGSKYLGANNPVTSYGASTVSQTVQGSGTAVINIKLGTGVRTLPNN